MIASVFRGAPAATLDRPVRRTADVPSPRRLRRPPIVPAIPTRSAPRAPSWSIRATIRVIGTMQYAETLPLEDHEVVLTFDDGPLPKYSYQILDILAAHCVKATFFLIGRQANGNPEGVRKVRDAGHTVGTHSQNHPAGMHRLPVDRARQEIDQGIASVTAALGDGDRARAVLPHSRPAAQRRHRGLSRVPRDCRSGAPIFRPTTGATSPPRASTISRSSGSRPRERASCCCTTFRRARSRRCRESCTS